MPWKKKGRWGKLPTWAVSPTLHEFASAWLAGREPELMPRTIEDYRWALACHLLPHLGGYRVSEIDAELVDRYKARKLAEGKLAPAQINKTLKRLSQILDTCCDYGYLPRNPAASKGGRRRVKEPPPRAPKGHRPLLATLAGAGLRVGEACALDWRDLNL
jgi:integrase